VLFHTATYLEEDGCGEATETDAAASELFPLSSGTELLLLLLPVAALFCCSVCRVRSLLLRGPVMLSKIEEC
jgi:hypothetical protein